MSENLANAKRTTLWIIFWAVLPLLGHILLVAITMGFVLWYVDGNSFGLQERGVLRAVGQSKFSWRDYTPLQSDINTVLSALLASARFTTVILCSDIFLKAILIMLEKSGLTARQISRMVMLGNVPLGKYTKRGGVNGYVWAIGIALALPFPAHLSSPLLSGAISWEPSHKLANGPALPGISTFTIDSLQWTAYQTFYSYRHLVAVNAARTSDVAWGSLPDRTVPTSDIKRDLPSAVFGSFQITNASVIHNLTVPYISLSNLRWISDLRTIPTEQLAAVDPGSSLMTALNPLHPLYAFPGRGNVVLIPPEPWQQQPVSGTPEGSTGFQNFAAPSARTVTQTMYVAVMAGVMIDDRPCNSLTTADLYGVYPPNAAFYEQRLNATYVQGGGRACIVFATIDVVAGVTGCSQCRLETGRTAVFEANHSVTPDADPLVNEALLLTSDTAVTMAQWNTSIPMAWNNIDTYVTTTLTRAYVSSWQSLVEFVGEGAPAGSKLSSEITWAVPTLSAYVEHWRVWAWLGLQGLVWLSAFIFYMAQYGCYRPMSGETFLSILFMDARSLGPGLSDYTKLTDEHKQRGRLELKEVSVGNVGTVWQLLPQGATTAPGYDDLDKRPLSARSPTEPQMPTMPYSGWQP